MPPLRERLEDLPVLIEHLVQRQQQTDGRQIRLDKEAMNCLARNPWPGNVRELANLLERLAFCFPRRRHGCRFARPLSQHRSGRVVRQRRAGSRHRVGTLLDELLEEGDVGAVHTGRERAVVEEGALTVTAELSDHELPRGGMDLKDHLSAIEIGLIRKALLEADGTVAEAARLLRMRRTTSSRSYANIVSAPDKLLTLAFWVAEPPS